MLVAFGPVKCDAPPVRAKPFDVQKASGYCIWNSTIFQYRSQLIQEIPGNQWKSLIEKVREGIHVINVINVFPKGCFWRFLSSQSFVVQSPDPWPLAPAASSSTGGWIGTQ
jgi:hypothetical protein